MKEMGFIKVATVDSKKLQEAMLDRDIQVMTLFELNNLWNQKTSKSLETHIVT